MTKTLLVAIARDMAQQIKEDWKNSVTLPSTR